MSRWLILGYSGLAYVLFSATFLYAFGFLGNVLVLPSNGRGPETQLAIAVAINSLLLAMFAVQNNLIARRRFKQARTRHPLQAVGRSTHVLLSSVALVLLFWQWWPIDEQSPSPRPSTTAPPPTSQLKRHQRLKLAPMTPRRLLCRPRYTPWRINGTPSKVAHTSGD